MKLLCRSVWLLLLACPVALAGDADKTSQAWEAFWSLPDRAHEPARQEALLEAIDADPSALAGLIRTDKAYQGFESGWNKRTLPLQAPDKTYQETYHFRVPRGYDPTRSYPVLLVCHGQGSNGRQIGAVYQGLLVEKVDEYILVAPTLPGPHLYTAQEHLDRCHPVPGEPGAFAFVAYLGGVRPNPGRQRKRGSLPCGGQAAATA